MPVHDLSGANKGGQAGNTPQGATPVLTQDVHFLKPEDLSGVLDGKAQPAGLIGITIGPDTDLDHLAPFVDRLAVIAIEFPAFKDGRGFSQARLLRDRFNYTGDIRAVGDLLTDQIQFLVRVGFSSVDLPETVSQAAVQSALERFTVVFQSAADSRNPVQRLRQSISRAGA